MTFTRTALGFYWTLCPMKRCSPNYQKVCLLHYMTRAAEMSGRISRKLYNCQRQYSYLKPSRVLCALHNVNSHKKIKSYPPTDVIYRTVVTEKTRDAEKPAIHKKRPVRKKTQEKEAIADHKNFAAYAVGDGLYIDQLERALREQKLYQLVKLPIVLDVYLKHILSYLLQPKDITDTLLATAKYRVDGKAREIFFFEDGSVVCWNMPASERLEVVKFAQKYAETRNPLQLVLDESEIMNVVTTDSIAMLKGNTVHIQEADGINPDSMVTETIILEKFAFSNGLAQSVNLSIKERLLDTFVESIEPSTQDLRNGKEVRMTRKTLNKALGEIFLLRHDINLSSDLLDTPDVYWEREELEILYKSMCTYLNIPKRTRVMNEKLNYCTQILDLFSSRMNDERHVRLEWFIIILILVEVAFECIHYAERYLERQELEVTMYRQQAEAKNSVHVENSQNLGSTGT